MRKYDFEDLIFRGVESDELDYKSAMSWDTMSRTAKGKIIRHLTAFANTKGGFLVIGVSEDPSGNPKLRTGVTPEQAGSFDPTPVGYFINNHIEPPIDFTIERPVIRGKYYVIFVVRPFKFTPHVCCKSIDDELRSGVFYIRTQEASSRPAYRAIEMQKLIQRAMRNSREELGRMLRGLLYETQNAVEEESGNICDDTVAESFHYFSRRVSGHTLPLLKLSVRPGDFQSGRYPLHVLRKAIENSWRLRTSAEFIKDGENTSLETPGSLRYLSREQKKMWQFFDSGLFCFFQFKTTSGNVILFKEFIRFCAEAVNFFANLYSELGWAEELLTLHLEIENAEKIILRDQAAGVSEDFTANSSTVNVEICRSAADLASGRVNHTLRLIRRVGELFRIPDFRLDHLEAAVAEILE